jgi:hypothetical protein
LLGRLHTAPESSIRFLPTQPEFALERLFEELQSPSSFSQLVFTFQSTRRLNVKYISSALAEQVLHAVVVPAVHRVGESQNSGQSRNG